MLSSSVYYREKVPKHTKYKEKPEAGRHLVKYPSIKEYEYYLCDYCNAEIRILEKKHEMTGGIAKFPAAITGKDEVELALCNKCLNPVLQELEAKLMIDKNYNHIPRVD